MQPAKVPIDPSSFKGLIVQQNDWKTNSIKTRVKKLVKGDQRKNGKGREGTMTWWKKEKKIGWKRAQSTLVDISEAAYTFSAGLRPSGATRHMHLGVRGGGTLSHPHPAPHTSVLPPGEGCQWNKWLTALNMPLPSLCMLIPAWRRAANAWLQCAEGEREASFDGANGLLHQKTLPLRPLHSWSQCGELLSSQDRPHYCVY